MLSTLPNSWLTPVRESKDLVRVRSLPKRIWGSEPDDGLLHERMNEWLRVPGSTATLFSSQAAALEAIHDFRGFLGGIAVGGGKTLITLLAPVVLDAKKPLLLIPKSLRDKTYREARLYAKDWCIARNLSILSYEKLSHLKSLDILERIQPDVIMCDECHCLKNSRGPRAKRIKRYLKAHPSTVFIGMSGSIMNRSLRDYWHIMKWCLPHSAPTPYDLEAFIEWCEALDETVPIRRPPGALLTLHPDAEGVDPTVRARDAYARRLAETPGVYLSRDKGPNMSLIVRSVEPGINRAKLEPAIRKLRESWEVPGGEPFSTALDLWRHVRSAVCGLVSVWDPPAPLEWLERRREWARFCRYAINTLRRNIDTPAHVAKMIMEGQLDDRGVLALWKEIEPTFEPNVKWIWIDDSMLIYAEKWLKEQRGLCWVEHAEFGLKLMERTGLPYFQHLGKDHDGNMIEEHSGPAIVSRQSNSIGRNLQKWSKNLLISHVPNGKQWEQTLGRTHRNGQQADEVIYEIPIISLEQYREVCKAIKDAEHIQAMTRQPQKLCYATHDIIDETEVEKRAQSDYLWQDAM